MSMLATREKTLDHIARILGRNLGQRWMPGDRLPPVRDLANEMGVSHGTVYRALKGMVREGVLVAKPRQGLFVSSHYSDSALRAMFPSRGQAKPVSQDPPLSGRRVVLFHSHESTHMAGAKQAIEMELSAQGCGVTQAEMIRQAPDTSGYDCVILINPSDPWNLASTPVRPVLVVTSAATCPPMLGDHWDIIAPDQEQGAALAGRHLRDLGCQDICFLGVSAHPGDAASIYETTSANRLHGLVAGWGKPLAASCLLRSPVYSPIGGAQAAKTYSQLEDRPRGIFAATDELAMGFISGAEALGLRLGVDYHIVGFDGLPQLNRLYPDGVSSVVVPAQRMGQCAVQMLISRWAAPSQPSRRLLLGCTLRQTKQADHSSHTGSFP